MAESKSVSITILRGCVGEGGKSLKPGQTANVTPSTARILIGGGKAEESAPKKHETKSG